MAELRLHANTRQELNEPEVNAIVNQICSKTTFAQVDPFTYNEYSRLAGPGIETWQIFQSKPSGLVMNQHSLDSAPPAQPANGKSEFKTLSVIRKETKRARCIYCCHTKSLSKAS